MLWRHSWGHQSYGPWGDIECILGRVWALCQKEFSWDELRIVDKIGFYEANVAIEVGSIPTLSTRL